MNKNIERLFKDFYVDEITTGRDRCEDCKTWHLYNKYTWTEAHYTIYDFAINGGLGKRETKRIRDLVEVLDSLPIKKRC